MSDLPNQDPDSDLDSLVRPRRQVFDYRLEPELPGTMRISRSSIGAAAEGAFGQVFRGEWLCEGEEPRIVALKYVKIPDKNVNRGRFRTRIKRETVLWKAASHPNVLPFIGYQIVEDRPILVSPWCGNGDLSAYIRATPGITRGDKVRLLRDAARGVVHLHSLDPPIVHGNLKPGKVIVQDNLVAAIYGFNLSKVHVGLDKHTGLTTSGRAGGTSGYQAPEILSDAPATPASDVYAFGGLILTAMSGSQPFWKMRQAATIIAVFRGQRPNPQDHPGLPEDDPLWDLLVKCWKGEADERPPMTEVLQTLEQDITPPESEPPSPRWEEPTREEESIVRPGYYVFARNLPPPIPGKLERGTQLSVHGGFGDVYKGTWLLPDGTATPVVIKCIRPLGVDQDERLKTRVKRETVIWSAAKHTNILPFIGYQIHYDTPMLVSPWCKNGSLDLYVAKHSGLTRSDKLKLISGAASGLLYLHSLKPPIFHGDIKPQNVIVQDNLEAVLCDFGISRIILEAGEHSGLTTADVCSGTSGYLAKEILTEGQFSTAGDVYAFGGLILAVMSGKPPFWKIKMDSAKTIAIYNDKKPVYRDHKKLPEQDSLWNVMQRCWDGEPDNRPRMLEVLVHLKA